MSAGVITTDKADPLPNRLAELYEELTALTEELQPSELALELSLIHI